MPLEDEPETESCPLRSTLTCGFSPDCTCDEPGYVQVNDRDTDDYNQGVDCYVCVLPQDEPVVKSQPATISACSIVSSMQSRASIAWAAVAASQPIDKKASKSNQVIMFAFFSLSL